MTPDGKKVLRGLAAVSPERQREIASMGGKAVKPDNRSFSRNRELAVEAGRKGGQNVPPEKRNFNVHPEFRRVPKKSTVIIESGVPRGTDLSDTANT